MDDEPRNNGDGTRRPMPEGVRFQPGNPGRPKGSRNKLGEAFTQALHDDFQVHGVAAIERARDEDPVQYLKVIASLLPKEVKIEQDSLSELPDDELARLIDIVRTAESSTLSPRGGEAETGGPH